MFSFSTKINKVGEECVCVMSFLDWLIKERCGSEECVTGIVLSLLVGKAC